ncbi:MAG: hypothetical protein ABI863_20025 [Ginsengibacter sp.]
MPRLESGFIQAKKDWCDISELIYNVTIRLGEELKNFIVGIDCSNTLPLFKIDYGLMDEVLYNLVQNVTRYAPGKSCISINANEISGAFRLWLKIMAGASLGEKQKRYLRNFIVGIIPQPAEQDWDYL